MGGIPQAENDYCFIIDLQAAGADAEETVSNGFRWGAKFAVENGPDGRQRILGPRLVDWALASSFDGSRLVGAGQTKHKQAERDGFAQPGVQMDTTIDFHRWEEHGDSSRSEEDLPEEDSDEPPAGEKQPTS